MKFDVHTLRKILPHSKFVNVGEDEIFTVLNIARLKQFESAGINDKILHFCVYDDNPDAMGWYNNPFDRTRKISTVREDKRVTFVVDSRVSDESLHGIRYIRVEDIFDAIVRIRGYVLSHVNPLVIGVTGSVGKTTCASLVESVLSKRFISGRIYSKRLTPLTLSSWIVNFLEESQTVLVLEYSMYRKNHIDSLMDILQPRIGVFLNVKRMHLGVEGINTLEDMIEGKEAIVRRSTIALLNLDDVLVRELKRSGDLGFSLVDRHADAFVSTEGAEAVLSLNFAGQAIRFLPYLKTTLFYQQAMVASLLGMYTGVSSKDIKEALEGFRPAESRIGWIEICDERVLFDGDVTISGRMASLSEHQYSTSILLVHSFDFGEENVELQVDDFARVFAKFSNVRILDTEENRMIVSRYSWKKVTFTKKADFFYGLSRFEFKVLHFGTYFRKHKDLSFLVQFTRPSE
jgi:UDP-N-acetylmuramyl pentapeptide synthase